MERKTRKRRNVRTQLMYIISSADDYDWNIHRLVCELRDPHVHQGREGVAPRVRHADHTRFLPRRRYLYPPLLSSLATVQRYLPPHFYSSSCPNPLFFFFSLLKVVRMKQEQR